MSGVAHVVLFRFRAATDDAARAEVSRRFQALETGERDGRRYIRSIRSGPNASPEGHGHGYDLGFLVEFESVADRDFYLDGDADHAAFSAFVGPLLDDVLVFDIAT